MNNSEYMYCRLCAEPKPQNILTNLQNDADICHKLSRFNIFLDLDEKMLPKTVCFLCSKSLESAFAFVTMVEQAQAILSNLIILHIQTVENVSDDINILYDETHKKLDTTDKIDDKTEINMNNEDCKNDPEDMFIEPPKDLKENGEYVIDIKKNYEVMSNEQCEINLNNEKCNNDYMDDNNLTYSEFENIDKTILNMSSSSDHVIKDTQNNLGDLNSKPTLGNVAYSTDYIKKQINKLATAPVDAIKNTWRDFYWKCSYCEMLFATADELKSHSMQYHNACNTYQCTDCNAKKLHLDGFIKHVRKHNKYLHYSCYKCFMKFTNPNATRLHKLTHYTSNYICMGCNTTFLSNDELQTHVQTFYKNIWMKKLKTERKRDKFCHICGMSFFNKQCLTRHMETHSDEKPFQCEICKHSFRTIYMLRYHAHVHSGVKPLTCDHCGGKFRRKNSLISHIKIHSELLPHGCTQCDKKFRTKSNLTNHMRQHTGSKPYVCEVCERDFTNWGNCNKHMKRKHGITKAKKKHTPLGPQPVDPATGEVIHLAMDKVLEWRKKMKEPLGQKVGRKKVKVPFENGKL